MDKNLFNQIVQFLVSLFSKGDELKITVDPPPPQAAQNPMPAPPTSTLRAIDWTDPKCQITAHFTVGDACMLHAWNRLANESDGLTEDIKQKLVATCQKMEEIREFLGVPMNAHCIFRSQEYNREVVKTIPADVHSQGIACDFDCNGHLTIEEVRQKLLPKLEEFNIRMEQNTATWIHLDTRAPGPSGRHFKA